MYDMKGFGRDHYGVGGMKRMWMQTYISTLHAVGDGPSRECGERDLRKKDMTRGHAPAVEKLDRRARSAPHNDEGGIPSRPKGGRYLTLFSL